MKRIILVSLVSIGILALWGLSLIPTKDVNVETAPDFTLNGIDGDSYVLSEMRGKVVVLYFWQANCPPCVAKIPDLAAMQDSLPDNVVLWLINLRDSQSAIKKLVADYPDLVVLTEGLSVIRQYNFRGTPALAFIDADGALAYGVLGSISAQAIDGKIQELLGNR